MYSQYKPKKNQQSPANPNPKNADTFASKSTPTVAKKSGTAQKKPPAKASSGKTVNRSSSHNGKKVNHKTPMRQSSRQNAASDPKKTSAPQREIRHEAVRQSSPVEPRTKVKKTPARPSEGTARSQNIRSFALFGKRLLLVFLCYLILMPASLLFMQLWLPHRSAGETRSFTYRVGDLSKPYRSDVLSWKQVCRGDVYYVNMTEIAAYCEMTTTGGHASLRYVIRDTGENVVFILNDSIAYVNGREERTEGSPFIDHHQLYVPLSFINHCFLGLSAAIDFNKNLITVSRETDDNGRVLPISLRYQSPKKDLHIVYDDLPQEIKSQIDQQNKQL